MTVNEIIQPLNEFEQAASKKIGKQKKQECERVMEINRLEHVVEKKAKLTANMVNQCEHVAKKKARLTASVVNQHEHVIKEKNR